MTVSAIGNYAPFIGLRYSFSRKRTRFTALISLVSMLGMVLGVASLITVLSVMNGFAGELRQRILALVPHGQIEYPGQGISDWQLLAGELVQHPGVLAVSPFISDKVIIGSDRSLRGAVLTAIVPDASAAVPGLETAFVAGSLADLAGQPYGIALGSALARILGVVPGDRVEVTVPRLTVTPLGIFPRSKRLLVTGLFEVGAQADAYQAYVTLATGQRLFAEQGRVGGLQIRTYDLYQAPVVMAELGASLPTGYRSVDWSKTQGSLFQAVKMEKIMVSLLLLSVVAVAAFNIVSTLVMSVAEKRSDIAVLRTMGAERGGIMAIFLANGLGLALVGIAAGALLGILLASNIAAIVAALESLSGLKLFDPSVYFISELPARLLWGDVALVVLASLGLSLLASIYPAWRAARIAPAEVLRYE